MVPQSPPNAPEDPGAPRSVAAALRTHAEATRGAVSENTERALKSDLRVFVADELEKLKSSQTGKKYTTRNSVICHAVCLLALEGFKPTRNKDKGGMASAKGGSACDAVGAALGMGYHNIELIWSADSPEKQLLRAVLAAEKK